MTRSLPLLLTVLAACGGPQTAAQSGCSLDTRGEELFIGFSKTGESLSFELTEVQDLPPIVGMNRWSVRVTDGTSAGVDMELQVETWMPEHNHGGFLEEVIEPQGDGVYTVDDLHIFMSGLWEVTLSIWDPTADSADPVDAVEIVFCIEG